MSESRLWRKGVAFTLMALIVLMLFIAAVVSTPAADAQDAHYTYNPDRVPPTDRLFVERGETSASFEITIGIDWGGGSERPVETTMNSSCMGNGDDNTGAMWFDFQPLPFTLNASNSYTQIVEVTATSLGGATQERYQNPYQDDGQNCFNQNNGPER